MAVALAMAPFVFLNDNFDPANLPQSAWVQAWGLAFAAWRLARVPRLDASAIDRPLAALIGWGLISIAWATSRGEAIPAALQWVACGAWFVAVSRTVSEPAQARVLATALFVSGAAVAAFGLAQHLFSVGLVYQAVPPASTFVNKNIASQYVVATLPLGLALLGDWRGRLRVTPASAACMGAAAVMAVFLVIATTRSAWLAAGVEALVVAALVARARRPRAMRWLAAAVVVLAVAAVAFAALRRQAPGAAAFTSVQHRQAIWMNTAAMIADAPLRGAGLGNHKVQYPPYARRHAVDERMGARAQLDHVHNDVLQLAAETGAIGVALAAWLLAGAIRTWRAAAAPEANVAMTWAWAAAFAGIAVDALFSFPMQRALPPVVLAVGLGSLAGLARLKPGPGRGAARALAVLALLALGFVVPYQLRAIRADRHVASMIAAERRGSWREAREHAIAALALVPGERHALFSLGTAELARRRWPEAQVALRAVLEDYPHDLPALGNLALAHTAAGEDAAALALWERVLALDPRDHRAHFARGDILDRRGDVDGALRAFRLAADHNNRDPRYHVRRAQAAARAGHAAEAITAFRTALVLAPGNVAAQEGLARALEAR